MMRRFISVLVVVFFMTIGHSGEIYFLGDNEVKSSSSSLNLVFANGPSENEVVTGLFTLSISSTGNGNISSIEIDISSDGSNWSSVANLTNTPWLKHVDTTAYLNDTYIFRARAWDSDVQSFTGYFTTDRKSVV